MSAKVLALLFLGAVAVLAQVYPPIARVNPPASVEIAAPPEVRRIFRGSCYDCHSNETRWPWYSYVAPGSWMVAGDVHDARSRMNFSRWPHAVSSEVDCYFKRRIIERIGKGEMPPLRYRLLHPSATVTDQDEALLRNWTTEQCGEGS